MGLAAFDRDGARIGCIAGEPALFSCPCPGKVGAR